MSGKQAHTTESEASGHESLRGAAEPVITRYSIYDTSCPMRGGPQQRLELLVSACSVKLDELNVEDKSGVGRDDTPKPTRA